MNNVGSTVNKPCIIPIYKADIGLRRFSWRRSVISVGRTVRCSGDLRNGVNLDIPSKCGNAQDALSALRNFERLFAPVRIHDFERSKRDLRRGV